MSLNFSSTLFIAILIGCSLSACTHASDRTRQPEYQQLERFLSQQNYKDADRETLNILLRATNREQEGWLRQDDVASIACETIVSVDWLWRHHSAGRYGWTVQQFMWEGIGGKLGQYNAKLVNEFGTVVEWRERSQWKQYDRLTFNADAPVGHLPASTGNNVSGAVWGGVATLAQKVSQCSIWNDFLPEPLQKKREAVVKANQEALQSGKQKHCQGCDLFGANLKGLDLRFGNFSLADLRQADLRGTVLGAGEFAFTDFRDANLDSAIFRQATLLGASFESANLAWADFHCGAGTCTVLTDVSFKDANLMRANLSCLDCHIGEPHQGLKSVNLSRANLKGADLNNTSLEGVNLCGATLPNGEQTNQGCE